MAVIEQRVSRGGDGVSPALRQNADYVEMMYDRWTEDATAVPESWRFFFQGFELAKCPRNCVSAEQARRQSQVGSLMYAYRNQGHLIAQLDPLGNNPQSHPDLEIETFGLTEKDLDEVFDTGHLGGPKRATLREIIQILRETYCRSVGVEYLHIQDIRMRRWLQGEMEPIRNRPTYDRSKRLEILRNLIDAELFEAFLFSRYPGQKRFSLEGAETTIAAIHALIELAPELGIQEIVLGMTHRGRLNVLANILDKSYATIFSEFDDNFIPDSYAGDGDVKYHKGYSSDHVNKFGHNVHVSLTPNPSHLEAVDPVVEGRARAKQRQRDDTKEREKVLPLLIHGDAAFAGQGLVAETLNLSQVEGYTTGGTVHLIINNQIGFTTLPHEARSSLYPTDVVKMIQAPIFHVNGDDPEAVVFVTELALRFRQKFGRDVVVDMVCYRRHGHNEGDEPAFTQPVLYAKIKDRPSVRRLYTKQLAESGVVSGEEEEQIAADFRVRLQQAFDEAKNNKPVVATQAFEGYWKGLRDPYSHDAVETGVRHERLVAVAEALSRVPEGFALNPKIERALPARLMAVRERGTVDWSLAESLAFGTLLTEGTPVRLSGQDSERGAFSQRHAVWQDVNTQAPYVPLNHIGSDQARFCVYNSTLSEAAVLGFEYGYAMSEPRMLVLWEAQFGDFANGAQVIIDQFLVASESKWQHTAGLVLLLPHGNEGQGADHSSAHLERYLMACAEDNIQVCNLTSPAQYFHALRRQMKRPFRRPLVIMTPKSLLRHPRCVSPADEFIHGRFQEVLDDPNPPADRLRRVLFCSGKVYYDLLEKRETDKRDDVAIVRIEQFYPFPEAPIAPIVERYRGAEEVVWVQEETQNRGGWTFMVPRLQQLFSRSRIRYAGRRPSAAAATGLHAIHKKNQAKIVQEAICD